MADESVQHDPVSGDPILPVSPALRAHMDEMRAQMRAQGVQPWYVPSAAELAALTRSRGGLAYDRDGSMDSKAVGTMYRPMVDLPAIVPCVVCNAMVETGTYCPQCDERN